MPNLDQLSTDALKAVALSNLILVTPQKIVGIQPQNVSRENGAEVSQESPILFHYEAENSVMLQSDITDHFVEDNTVINDQIALRPEMITTNGLIGELNDVAGYGLQTLKSIADKLTVISGYEPELSVSAQIAYNNAKFAYDVAATVAKSAVSAWSTITGTGGQAVVNGNGISGTGQSLTQTKQELIFQQFYGYWRNRRLFTVQTPWAIFQDMAIERLRAIQDQDTRMITDFEVTFKLLRFAKTKIVRNETSGVYDFNNMQARAYNQASPEVNIGPNTPQSAASLTSLLGVG